MPCNKCGKCCEAIPIRYSKKDLRDALREGTQIQSARFILANWIRISKKEAKRINPNLKGYTMIWFYRCTQYDTENHRCKVYRDRPNVCKKFPKYSKFDPAVLSYVPECGFHKELQ